MKNDLSQAEIRETISDASALSTIQELENLKKQATVHLEDLLTATTSIEQLKASHAKHLAGLNFEHGRALRELEDANSDLVLTLQARETELTSSLQESCKVEELTLKIQEQENALNACSTDYRLLVKELNDVKRACSELSQKSGIQHSMVADLQRDLSTQLEKTSEATLKANQLQKDLDEASRMCSLSTQQSAEHISRLKLALSEADDQHDTAQRRLRRQLQTKEGEMDELRGAIELLHQNERGASSKLCALQKDLSAKMSSYECLLQSLKSEAQVAQQNIEDLKVCFLTGHQ